MIMRFSDKAVSNDEHLRTLSYAQQVYDTYVQNDVNEYIGGTQIT